MKTIFLLIVLLVLTACTQAPTQPMENTSPAEEPAPVMCTMQYDPVCGTVERVRKTFGNDCMARAAQATDITPGECDDSIDKGAIPKPCTREYRPVCGRIQVECIMTPCDPVWQTFANRCMAENARAVEIQEGACTNT